MTSTLWLTGHQPNYLPYPGFFSKVLQAEAFVIVDHVQIQKEQKRNLIASSDGLTRLSLHVNGSKRQRICEARLNQADRILKKHWESIHATYSKYPFYETVASKIHAIYATPQEKFSSFTISLILAILDLLGYEKPVFQSSAIVNDSSAKNNELIINLCQTLGYDGYISGTGAKAYIDETKFRAAKVRHRFNEYRPIAYHTPRGPSIDNLCILDPLFSIGPSQTKALIQTGQNT